MVMKIKTGERTIGHDFTLMKGQSRLDELTKLSADCVHASHLDGIIWYCQVHNSAGDVAHIFSS